jgi:SAM-dependent methyltransferase
MDERQRWESRYAQSDGAFYGRGPSPFLLRSLPLLPAPGRCIDFAGGQGRNAVLLARHRWQVTVVDVALAGLAAARQLARDAGVEIGLVHADLGRTPLHLEPASLDLVLVVNYHNAELIRSATTLLHPGGVLLVEGFSIDQYGRPSGGPQEAHVLWRPNQLLELATPLRVLWYEDRLTDEDDNPRHRGEKAIVRLIARKDGG